MTLNSCNPESSNVEKLTRCARCGVNFGCGTGGGNCWCCALPKVMPVPTDPGAACLCPRCLEACIKSQQEADQKG